METDARSSTRIVLTVREEREHLFDQDDRWAARCGLSRNLVTAPDGGYDLARDGSGTRVTIYNVLEGHGPGRLIAPLALRSARKGADDFGTAIKAAVEAS